jgi:hypothetical protein
MYPLHDQHQRGYPTGYLKKVGSMFSASIRWSSIQYEDRHYSTCTWLLIERLPDSSSGKPLLDPKDPTWKTMITAEKKQAFDALLVVYSTQIELLVASSSCS